MNDTADILAKNIKKLRKLKGLSQKEVCANTGILQGQYSTIENAKVVPTIPTLDKLASFFEVPLTDFFEIEDINGNINLPLMEKVKLISMLEDEEKNALIKLIDMAIAKKRLKDNLSNLIAS